MGLLRETPPACDRAVDVSDAVRLFHRLFTDERETLPKPYPDCARYDMLHAYRPLPSSNQRQTSGQRHRE